MRKIVLFFVMCLTLFVFVGCKDNGFQGGELSNLAPTSTHDVESAYKTDHSHFDSDKEETTAFEISDPMKLILGTWKIAYSVDSDGDIYEGDKEKEEILIFYPDGFTDFDGDEGIWILQEDYLTICDGKYEERFFVKTLTEDEMTLAEGDDSEDEYVVCQRMEWGNLKYEIPSTYMTDIVGRWVEPGWEDSYIQFNADGTGIADGDGYYTFRWSVLNGNRLKILYAEGKQTMVIWECDENILRYGYEIDDEIVAVREF